MNRTELVDSVASATGLEKKQADAAVSATIDAIVGQIKSGTRVSIFGFGTFDPKSRPARMGRNPQTNQPMRVAASKSVGFKPATAFKEALKSRGGAKKAPASKAAAKKSAAGRTAAAKKAPARKTTAKKTTAAKKTAAKKR